MPTIELDRKTVEKIVGKRLSDNDLKHKIPMFGTPLEELTKNEIKVEIFPNRPDLLSEQGFGRAFASFLGVKKGLKQYKVLDSRQKVIVENAVDKVRPHTACAIVKGLKFDEERIKEIIKIQEKLHVTYGRHRKRCAIGVYPLDKITFPVRYTAKKPSDIHFRPLEANRMMTGAQILDQHPTGKEYKHLLEGETVYPLFIDAKGHVLSMPPIINSNDIGKIVSGTKDVFVECTGFNSEVLKKCINIIVTALADMGGTIYSVDVVKGKTVKMPSLAPEHMKLDTAYVNKRLGLSLKEQEIKSLLEKMGFGYDAKKKEALVPAYRTDIIHPIDLVEDIAIAYGYDNFKEEIPNIATIGKEDAFEKFKSKIAHALVGMRLDEINSTNIIEAAVQTKKMLLDHKPVMLANALTTEYNSLRSLLIPSLLLSLQQNKDNEYPQNIFETGTVFARDKEGKTETGVLERTRLAVAVCHKHANYTEVRQLFERLCALLGVKPSMKREDHPSFIPGRVARASVNGVAVAYIGELHPEVLANFELEMPVAVFELNLSDLFSAMHK
jgi:phenylalanyl-tRNA synthetase beta chain